MKKDSQKTSSQTVKKVIIRIKKYWVFLILSIIMATITVASSLYVPILVGNAIDYIIGLVSYTHLTLPTKRIV